MERFMISTFYRAFTGSTKNCGRCRPALRHPRFAAGVAADCFPASSHSSVQPFQALFGVLASTSAMDSFAMHRTALLLAVLLDLLRGFFAVVAALLLSSAFHATAPALRPPPLAARAHQS